MNNSHATDLAHCQKALPLLRMEMDSTPAGFVAKLILGEVPCYGAAAATEDDAIGNALMAAELEGWPLPEP